LDFFNGFLLKIDSLFKIKKPGLSDALTGKRALQPGFFENLFKLPKNL